MTWTGQRIRDLRRALTPTKFETRKRLRSHPRYATGGLTQHELAGRLGVTARTVSRWESGASQPYWFVVDALERLEARDGPGD